MYLQKLEDFPPPPGVMGSLRAGFDVVSRHVALILLPAVLDILLWLGPRLSIGKLIKPTFPDSLAAWPVFEQIIKLQASANEAGTHFNLLSLLGRIPIFPIGVSSLLTP